MEGVSASIYTKMRGYWKRRGYERINGSGRVRNNSVELGSTPRRRRRFWRIKIKPKVKIFKMSSPRKFFVWLRDAYVKMMLGIANSRSITTSGFGGTGFGGFSKGPMKEYDEKMIIEIYKSLVIAQEQLAQRQLVPGQLVAPASAAKFGSMPKLAAIVE